MFFSFGLKDLIDILLVAVLLYYAYRLMKESRSLNIFFGVLIWRCACWERCLTALSAWVP